MVGHQVKDLLFMLFFVSTISSVVYLRWQMQIQAKPMNRKILELFTLQRRKKLLQTGYRLTFSYSKLGLASFASDKRDKGLAVKYMILTLTTFKNYSIG